jgi:hypothetical protein
MITLIRFFKFSTVVELNIAELFSLADVTRTAEDCRLLLKFRTALPRHGYKIQGELYGCLCVPLSFVACHKICVTLYSPVIHTVCHSLVW